jgi:hypothetical protein
MILHQFEICIFIIILSFFDLLLLTASFIGPVDRATEYVPGYGHSIFLISAIAFCLQQLKYTFCLAWWCTPETPALETKAGR